MMMKSQKNQRHPVLIRMDLELMAKIDKLAKKRFMTRNACVQYILSVALENAKL
jgi:predicted transcriptional regulator